MLWRPGVRVPSCLPFTPTTHGFPILFFQPGWNFASARRHYEHSPIAELCSLVASLDSYNFPRTRSLAALAHHLHASDLHVYIGFAAGLRLLTRLFLRFLRVRERYLLAGHRYRVIDVGGQTRAHEFVHLAVLSHQIISAGVAALLQATGGGHRLLAAAHAHIVLRTQQDGKQTEEHEGSQK